MKQVFKLVLACAVGILPMSVGAKDSEATEVRKMIDKVNQHWQAENSPEVRSFWDNAVYHTGNMEAYFLTGNETYRAYSETWANYNQWKGAKSNNRAEWKYSYGESDEYVLLATIRYASRLIPICTIWIRMIRKSDVRVRLWNIR